MILRDYASTGRLNPKQLLKGNFLQSQFHSKLALELQPLTYILCRKLFSSTIVFSRFFISIYLFLPVDHRIIFSFEAWWDFPYYSLSLIYNAGIFSFTSTIVESALSFYFHFSIMKSLITIHWGCERIFWKLALEVSVGYEHPSTFVLI